MRRVAAVSTLWAVVLLAAWPARAEDGYDLWLRYRPLPAEEAAAYRAHTTQLVLDVSTPMRGAARAELLRAFSGLLGSAPAVTATITADGAILAGTPGSSPQIAGLHLSLRALGNEGYMIRSVTVDGHAATVIAANSDRG
ncbi:MAG TPA: alpha-glucuronidase family glycosyl hydrolase, partial [Steroidobacteraceae bacterium]|nr:alpha-glucuronidase family glycosyl hydrolase [Steroidobacteraceae bacterium]